MRRLVRGGMMMTLASMAWRNREAIQRAVRGQTQKRSVAPRR